ncbi:CD4-2 molecule, tandem duplicate 2 [Puntigrus tetrazona]|uniref:CD4-2 molecule, tandem duplicate 2 n=1 Tax=Puntigrus tetrazona TaxID=1606681 RepID=UPI001C8A5C29|nr:CD4-2 molecule, tandem duplicate 2 [Puntigrus tetrazona]
MAISKILFFLLALCIWRGKCDVLYKRVGDEVSMKCGLDSSKQSTLVDWTFEDKFLLGTGKGGTVRKGNSHIVAKASIDGNALKVSKLETRDTGVYSCRQSGKRYTLRVVSVFVHPGPVLVQSSNAELHCDVTQEPNTAVRWQRPNGEEYSEKTQVIHLKSVTLRDAGQWTCEVTEELKPRVTLTVVVDLYTTAVNVSEGDDIKLPCSLPPSVSQRVVGAKWKADHLPTVSFPTLKNTGDKGLHWNSEDLSKVNFTTGKLSTNFDVTLKNVERRDAGVFVCRVEFEGEVSLSVETTLTVIDKPSGGDSISNPQSEITKIIGKILEMAVPSICGPADSPDRALLKLKKLKRCVDDAEASLSSTVSSQDIFPCPPDKLSHSQDTEFAHSIAPENNIESLERKKLNLQIKLLEIQNELYALQLKALKNSQFRKKNRMAICKILLFLLALCIWRGKCDVLYKRVGDEVSMKCGLDSSKQSTLVDWTFEDKLLLGTNKGGTVRKGNSHIVAKASIDGNALKVSKLETRDTGVYSCRQSGKRYTLRVVSVFVHPGPVLVQSSNAELHCDVTQEPNTAVRWQRPNGEEYSEKTQVIHLKSVTLRDAGQWTCKVTEELKPRVTLTVVVDLYTTAVNVSEGDDIKLPCSLPPSVSQRVVGAKWKADHLPTVSFPTLKNTGDKGLHWNSEDLSKVNFTTGKLSTNFDVTLKNVERRDAGVFVCRVEFEGEVSLSVETTLTVIDKPSGGKGSNKRNGKRSGVPDVLFKDVYGVQLWIWIAVGVSCVVLIGLFVVAVLLHKRNKREKQRVRKLRSMRQPLTDKDYCQCNRIVKEVELEEQARPFPVPRQHRNPRTRTAGPNHVN